MESIFIVEIQEKDHGLAFETDASRKHVVLSALSPRITSPHPSSAHSGPALRPGAILCSINGTSVLGKSFDESMDVLMACGRPLAVGFSQPKRNRPFKPTHTARARSRLSFRCVLREPIWENMTAIDDGRSAYVLRRFTVPHRSRSTHIKCREIPNGYILSRINGSKVKREEFSVIIATLEQHQGKEVKLLFKRYKGQPMERFRSSLGKIMTYSRHSFSMDSLRDDTEISGSTKTDEGDSQGESQDGESSCASQVHKATGKVGDHHEEVLLDYSSTVVSISNLEWAYRQIHSLLIEERLISAGDMLEKVEEFLHSVSQKALNLDEKRVVENVRKAYEGDRQILDQLRERRAQGIAALKEFNQEEESGWTFAQTYFGVTTYWKPGDDGTIWIKLDGLCEGVDVFNCLAVIRETDMFHLWAPFCNKSQLLSQVNRVEVVTYLNIKIPLMQRDAVVHAFGINATYEHGCVVLLGNSVDSWPKVEFPPITGFGSDRMTLKAFRALIEPHSTTSARTCIVANVDPKCPVPKSLLNFATKKMAGVLLYFLLKQAQKIDLQSEDDPYGSRILSDPTGFYEWITPRIHKYFQCMQSGTLPKRLDLRDGQPPARTPFKPQTRTEDPTTNQPHSALKAPSLCAKDKLQPDLTTRGDHLTMSDTQSVSLQLESRSSVSRLVHYCNLFIWPLALHWIYCRIFMHDIYSSFDVDPAWVAFAVALAKITVSTAVWYVIPSIVALAHKLLSSSYSTAKINREISVSRKTGLALLLLWDVLSTVSTYMWSLTHAQLYEHLYIVLRDTIQPYQHLCLWPVSFALGVVTFREFFNIRRND